MKWKIILGKYLLAGIGDITGNATAILHCANLRVSIREKLLPVEDYSMN